RPGSGTTGRHSSSAAGGEGMAPLPTRSDSLLEAQQLRDDQPLHFRGSRISPACQGVAQISFHFMFRQVAVTSVNLHRVEAGLNPALADVELGQGTFQED